MENNFEIIEPDNELEICSKYQCGKRWAEVEREKKKEREKEKEIKMMKAEQKKRGRERV